MNEKQRKTLDSRIARDKEKVLESLRKLPVVHAACGRAGVSKATFYRWKSEDDDFAANADAALSDGKELVTDAALSQLITAVKSGNMTAVKAWLSTYHADFKTKVEVGGTIQIEHELSPEKKKWLEEAVRYAASLGAHHDDSD